MRRCPHLTKDDHDRLARLVRNRRVTVFEMEQLKILKGALGRAKVVAPEEIPSDAVTLGSEVLLKDIDRGGVRTHELVLPDEARAENSISILTPLGIAMLGRRAGDIIELAMPNGVWRLKVLDVLSQPEPAGAFRK